MDGQYMQIIRSYARKLQAGHYFEPDQIKLGLGVLQQLNDFPDVFPHPREIDLYFQNVDPDAEESEDFYSWYRPPYIAISLSGSDLDDRQEDWIRQHISLFDFSRPLRKNQAIEIALNTLITLNASCPMDAFTPYAIAALLLVPVLLIQHPQDMLAMAGVDQEKLDLLRGIEPLSMSYFRSHHLPGTGKARTEYAAGLQDRAMTWDQVKDLLDLDTDTRITFPSISATLKQLNAANKAQPKADEQYVIFQYDTKGRLIARYDTEEAAREKLGPGLESLPLEPDHVYKWQKTRVVKRRRH
ncbi:hypothetical protein [uncultured Faecalibaculum sp.]|uniref:hypothetical protein n=1 Tax=uncultured Faecalibaculum sp. TaxID=1729681 RepID=UPI002615362C|nr:hypothetical protein [uncultured Faecalibaculum sp.]